MDFRTALITHIQIQQYLCLDMVLCSAHHRVNPINFLVQLIKHKRTSLAIDLSAKKNSLMSSYSNHHRIRKWLFITLENSILFYCCNFSFFNFFKSPTLGAELLQFICAEICNSFWLQYLQTDNVYIYIYIFNIHSF